MSVDFQVHFGEPHLPWLGSRVVVVRKGGNGGDKEMVERSSVVPAARLARDRKSSFLRAENALIFAE